MIHLVTGFDEPSVAALVALASRLSESGRQFALGRPSGTARAMRVAQLLCLASYVGATADEVSIATEANGRPVVLGGGAIEMSASHAGSTLAVAFGDQPVGVDIEHLRRRDAGVMRRLFSADEACSAIDDESFTHMWVRKEAYAKWTGVGLGEYLTDGMYRTRVTSSRRGEMFLGVAGEGDHEIAAISVRQLLASASRWATADDRSTHP